MAPPVEPKAEMVAKMAPAEPAGEVVAPKTAPMAAPAAEAKPDLQSSLMSAAGQLGTKSDAIAAATGFDVNAGITQALNVAADRAVDYLTGPNGLMSNASLQIPLPESVEKLRKPLTSIGQEQLLNQFSTTMNGAATEALKLSPEILKQTISNLDVNNVASLLQGGDTAFTQYLDQNARGLILAKITPIIAQTTAASGATQYYKQISTALEQKGGGGLMAAVQTFTGVQLPSGDFDLDAYIANAAVGRLFEVVAVEEQKMRADPKARSTELLQTLFGQFTK